MVASLVSDFSALRPTLVSHISASYYLLFNVGSAVGLLVGAELLPPSARDHGYFWSLLVLMLLLTIAILNLPQEALAAQRVVPPDLGDDDPARRLLLRRSTSHRLSSFDSARLASGRMPSRAVSLKAAPSKKSPLGASSAAGVGVGAAGSGVGAAGGESTDSCEASFRSGCEASFRSEASGGAPMSRKSRPGEALIPRSQRCSNLHTTTLQPPPPRSHLLEVACAKEYRPFRMVVAARTLFYCASGIFQSTALFFVSDHIELPHGATGLHVAGMAAIVMVLVAILAAAPIGKLNQLVGPVPCVVASTVVIAALMSSLPFVNSVALLLAFATLFGLSICLFSVADLALIVQTLPNDATSGTDIGVWNTFQYVGIAVGASICGPILSSFTEDFTENAAHGAIMPSPGSGGASPISPPPPALPPLSPMGVTQPPTQWCPTSCATLPRDHYRLEGCASRRPPPRLASSVPLAPCSSAMLFWHARGHTRPCACPCIMHHI